VHKLPSRITSVIDETNNVLVAQDGIPRFVSKTVMCRMMWRRFNAFVTCKNCGGRPIPRVGRSGVATGQLGAPGQDASEVRGALKHFQKYLQSADCLIRCGRSIMCSSQTFGPSREPTSYRESWRGDSNARSSNGKIECIVPHTHGYP
jgi:hypothetical protein